MGSHPWSRLGFRGGRERKNMELERFSFDEKLGGKP